MYVLWTQARLAHPGSGAAACSGRPAARPPPRRDLMRNSLRCTPSNKHIPVYAQQYQQLASKTIQNIQNSIHNLLASHVPKAEELSELLILNLDIGRFVSCNKTKHIIMHQTKRIYQQISLINCGVHLLSPDWSNCCFYFCFEALQYKSHKFQASNRR